MLGVLEGFATIGTMIAAGVALAHLGVVDRAGQRVLTRFTFSVASPALMAVVLGRADLPALLSRPLVATAGAVAVSASVYVVLAVVWWRRRVPELTVGALSASFVNAANLGIPLSVFVLGDEAWVASVLLLQLLVVQPAALATLDVTARPAANPGRLLARILANPVLIGSLAGVAVSVTGWVPPDAVRAPVETLAGAAVPTMLVAYGVSLRLGALPGGGGAARSELVVVSALKLVVQPLGAYTIGRWLELDADALRAVTVLAALPTAQNVFVHATRYGRGEAIARDAVLVTTLGSVLAILGIAWLLP